MAESKETDDQVVDRIRAGLKRTRDMFSVATEQNTSFFINPAPLPSSVLDPASYNLKVLTKVASEYKHVKKLEKQDRENSKKVGNSTKTKASSKETEAEETKTQVPPQDEKINTIIEKADEEIKIVDKKSSQALVSFKAIGMPELEKPQSRAMQIRAMKQRTREGQQVKPEWHAPWKLMRVIQGHLGWVRSIAVDPTNKFFVTGSSDRTIKVWDLASGKRLLTLTGHVNAVRGLAISDRHPYMFSASEDKSVKCWDLETNRIIRHYHGHLSGVYSLALHPTLDVLVSGGRDSCARVWDMRTSKEVHILGGHINTVSSLITQDAHPQVVTGSADSTIKLWDLAAGKAITTLTNHKKGIRALVKHPREFTFLSGAADTMKKWHLKEGKFLKNFNGHDGIVNSLSINHNNVLVSGGDNGSLKFWDWPSGHCFYSTDTVVQPGSLESEASILASSFDVTGTRLFTCEGDKTIKVWKEDEEATPESHPLDWKPSRDIDRF